MYSTWKTLSRMYYLYIVNSKTRKKKCVYCSMAVGGELKGCVKCHDCGKWKPLSDSKPWTDEKGKRISKKEFERLLIAEML